jgi:hypothetical protein
MGLLDDAIREHLELKRRRGADASEISRQEADALGPVRRSPENTPEPSGAASAEDPVLDAAAPAAEPPTPSEPTPWEDDETPPWEDATTVHEPPSPAYEPPPLPSAAVTPPAHVEPPRATPPLPPEPEPEAYEPPSEPPPGEDSEGASLLSRLNPAARLRDHRRDPLEEAPAPPAAPPPAAHEPPSAPPAHEPDIVPADEEPEGEDLLEETPEFLEETPEHDRLWFEQRPPRDFDFDG